MPIRLNKALKELNVGINTVAELLQKRGLPMEDASPNAKLSDEQYSVVLKEFGKDKNAHAEVQAQKARKEREEQERKEQQRREQQRQQEEKKKQQFKILGNINDQKPKAEAPAEQPKSAPAPVV